MNPEANPAQNHTAQLVAGVAGAAICLPLSNSGTTGFNWELELPSGVTRVADVASDVLGDMPSDASKSISEVTGQTKQLGDGPNYQLYVQADAGSYLIIARLVRAWDKAHPISVMQIQLEVK